MVPVLVMPGMMVMVMITMKYGRSSRCVGKDAA